jgi:hypothetical protein
MRGAWSHENIVFNGTDKLRTALDKQRIDSDSAQCWSQLPARGSKLREPSARSLGELGEMYSIK